MTLDRASLETHPVKPDAQAAAERDDEHAIAALLDDSARVASGEADAEEGTDGADPLSPEGADAAVDASGESAFDDILFEVADAASEAPAEPVGAPADAAFADAPVDAAEVAPATETAGADAWEDPGLAFDDTLLREIAGAPAGASAPADSAADTVSADTFLHDTLLLDTGGAPPASPPDRAGHPAEAGLAFDDALLEVIDAAPAASSDQADETADSDLIVEDALFRNIDAASDAAFAESDEPAPGAGPGFADALLVDPAAAPDAPAETGYEDAHLEAIPIGPAAALAFATDAETEVALRDGLSGFEGSSPDCGEAQVWQGDLRTAIGALAAGQSAELIFVDIDGIRYPAGAIHELAAVCEMGTVVVAVGSDGSARPGRELQLAGVSDYLAKPLTADAVRAAAARATIAEADSRPSGCAAGFIGTGGSGTTTLAAAVAIHAAARGCYVSVLDLGRSVAAAAFSLGVEPAAGLDQLLETAEQEAPGMEVVEGVCVRRSERIEVYAHRWSPTQPAAPQVEAVDRLVAALKRRSKLVLVDGFDTPALRCAPPAALDARVFVAEPTAGSAAHAARIAQMIGTDHPMLFVQNHTRAFKRAAGARNLRNAGIESEPDVVVPFEPALPEAADRGWPHDRLPRSLREPLTTLTDRILGSLAGTVGAPLLPLQES